MIELPPLAVNRKKRFPPHAVVDCDTLRNSPGILGIHAEIILAIGITVAIPLVESLCAAAGRSQPQSEIGHAKSGYLSGKSRRSGSVEVGPWPLHTRTSQVRSPRRT